MMTKSNWILLSACFGIICSAYALQALFFVSPDVGYLLHASNQILSGKKYGLDIFETNPPMILYLYLPACLLTKWFFLHIYTALRIYVLFLATFSLIICKSIFEKLFSQSHIMKWGFITLLFFTFYFLPLFEFGQREHLLIILMMPYLFSAVLFIENKKISPILASIIGIFAGLGFGLKPFFLIPLCLIELYIIYRKKNLLGWIRIESVFILFIMTLYLFSIYYFQRGYLQEVLPQVMQFYFVGTSQPLQSILHIGMVYFCLFTIFAFILFYKNDNYHTINMPIWLALIGMTIAFIVPHSGWLYHLIPAVAFAILLICSFLIQTLESSVKNANSYKTLIAETTIILGVGLMLLWLPLYNNYQFFSYFFIHKTEIEKNKIAQFINSQTISPSSITCFTILTADCFPLVDSIHSQFTSRFPSFWWYLGWKKLISQPMTPIEQQDILKAKNALIDNVAEDLNRYKTQFIIVNNKKFNEIPLNFISDFSENNKFKEAWKHYQYLLTINNHQIYKRQMGT